MNTMFVKPSKAGAMVRFPDDPQRRLQSDGEEVPRTPYWIRRVNDGSVCEAKPKTLAKEAGK